MRVALDAMGGDLAPKAAVEGGVLAARDFGIEVILVGDREIVARELAEHNTAGLKIRIEHAPEVVLMDDSPLESIINKPQSSLHVGFGLVKSQDADAFVSAGNSGAMMAAAMVILGNLASIDRPAIASPVPTPQGHALLIDAGANTEVKPINLVQFAVMGTVYWRRLRNVSRPRVGILSNGEESSKGNDLTRAAAGMLGQMGSYVNYIGYVEGRDINRGKVDVIVTDGFTGNVALKTMEGFAAFMLGNLRELFGGSWPGRLAYFLIRRHLAVIRERLDPYETGGAPLLGVNGVAIIAHGSSTARAIRNAVRAAANEALVNHVNFEISEILGRTQIGVPAKAGGKGIRALFSRMRERLHRHPKEIEAPKPHDSPAVDTAASNHAPARPQEPSRSSEEYSLHAQDNGNASEPPAAGLNGSKPIDHEAPASDTAADNNPAATPPKHETT